MSLRRRACAQALAARLTGHEGCSSFRLEWALMKTCHAARCTSASRADRAALAR